MKYPINEAELTEQWLAALDNPDEADRTFVEAMVASLSQAYNAGLAHGKKTA